MKKIIFILIIIFLFMNESIAQSINVFGQSLSLCCNSPKTGFLGMDFVIQDLLILELM